MSKSTVAKVYQMPVSAAAAPSDLVPLIQSEIAALVQRDLAAFNKRGRRWMAVSVGSLQRRETLADVMHGTMTYWQQVQFQRVEALDAASTSRQHV